MSHVPALQSPGRPAPLLHDRLLRAPGHHLHIRPHVPGMEDDHYRVFSQKMHFESDARRAFLGGPTIRGHVHSMSAKFVVFSGGCWIRLPTIVSCLLISNNGFQLRVCLISNDKV